MQCYNSAISGKPRESQLLQRRPDIDTSVTASGKTLTQIAIQIDRGLIVHGLRHAEPDLWPWGGNGNDATLVKASDTDIVRWVIMSGWANPFDPQEALIL